MPDGPRTRQQLAVLLNDRMNKTYSALADDARLERQCSLVKTYMLEAHPGGRDRHDDALRLLNTALSGDRSPLAGVADVQETEEEGFFHLEVLREDSRARLYIDASEPRFWLVHSVDRSEVTDWAVTKLVCGSRELDTAWLPTQLLRQAVKQGAFRGLGLDFDGRPLSSPESDRGDNVLFLKMQLWGNQAQQVLDLLSSEDAFPRETTLSKVRVKHWIEGSSDAFSLDDLKYDGKVTARGTSFQSHIEFTTNVYRSYERWVTHAEHELSIRYGTTESPHAVSGCPMGIRFSRPLVDIEGIAERLFSTSPPFRLWGVPQQISAGYLRVAAVDLHVGHPLDVEITSDLMRVYLPEGGCGNTLLRLYTNIQHTLDAQATAEGPGGEPLFV